MKLLIVGLCALVGLGTASTASAVDFKHLGEFAGAPRDGLTTHHKHLAVHRSTGYLFVANTVDDRVDIYTPSATGATLLTSFGSGELLDPDGLAVDQSDGSVYVADAGHNRIAKYETDHATTPSFTEAAPADFTSPAQGSADDQIGRFDAALATAPDGDLWIADPGNNRLKRYNADGSYDNAYIDGSGSPDGATFDGVFTGLLDVAVDSTGDVLAVDQNGDVATTFAATSRLERFGADGMWKENYPTAMNPGAVAVYLNDEVVVSTNQDSYNTSVPMTLMTFGPGASLLQTMAIPGDMGADNAGSAAVYSHMTGLATAAGPAQRTYAATDADALTGEYGAISIQAYEIPQPVSPSVTSSVTPTYTAADVRVSVHPGLADTTYHVEYGDTDTYGHRSSAQTVAAGDDPDRVVASTTHLADLMLGATYHYRVVATNDVGTTIGPDKAFTTLTREPGEGCPNAEIRDRQHAEVVPDCRGWEMVSPVDKNHGDAGGTQFVFSSVQSSLTGNAVAFFSNDAFAGAMSASTGGAYVATRGPAVWSTQAILPPVLQDNGLSNRAVFTNFISSDLSKAMVMTSAPITEDAPPNTRNVYVRDNTTGRYQLVTPAAPLNAVAGSPEDQTAVGVSESFDHVLIRSPYALTADAPTTTNSNLYEWAAGTPGVFRLAGRLPDGSFDPGGAAAGGQTAGGTGSFDHAMSADGSRIFFNSPAGASNVYMSQNGAPSIQISATGRFWTATPSGSAALFTDGALKRYDVATGAVTDLSPDQEPSDGTDPGVRGVVGASDDLSRVYFTATGRLVPGKGVEGERNLYLSANGTVTFIGTLNPDDGIDGADDFPTWTSGGQRAVTSDGRQLAFVSEAQLTDYDNRVVSAVCPDVDAHPGPCREVYLYDAERETLSCPSCAGSAGHSSLASDGGGILKFVTLHQAQRNFSADGSRLYFQSAKALVPEDANGVSDVYQWVDGRPRLVSSGTGGEGGSQLMGVSPSGTDVFFTTRQRLVSQDEDTSNDVYDARIGGGFSAAADPAPPCRGDACHASASAPPVLASGGSITFFGADDARPGPPSRTPGKPKVARANPIVGSAGRLRVTVPAKGRLTTSGIGLRSTTKAVVKAGTYSITVSLSARAVRALRTTGRYTTNIRVGFTPAGGKGSSVRVHLTFKRPKATSKARSATSGAHATIREGR